MKIHILKKLSKQIIVDNKKNIIYLGKSFFLAGAVFIVAPTVGEGDKK